MLLCCGMFWIFQIDRRAMGGDAPVRFKEGHRFL